MRTRRDSGMAAHWLVCCFGIAIAAIVLSSEATIVPFYKEQQRLPFSDEAFALAEAGIALERIELERAGKPVALSSVPLGRGHVSVVVETAPPGEAVVVATGSVDAATLVGKGGTLTRRIRARFRTGAGSGPRLALLEWKEL